MKTLIISPYNIKTVSRSIMLDQLAVAIDNKAFEDEVYYLNCNNAFSSCYYNFEGNPEVCFSCRMNASKNLSLIKGDFTHIDFNDIISFEDLARASEFCRDNPEIDFNTNFEGLEIGEALLSVYISNTRNRDLGLANNSTYVQHAKKSTIALYLAVKRFLIEKKIDKVISFNGRQDYTRAVLRAANAVGIDCYNYERTRPGGYIEYFKNNLPHNIIAKTKWIEKAWRDESFSQEEKEKIGAQFYIDKKEGKAVIDKSYVVNQQKGFVEDYIRNHKKNIVLFNSSDDEFAAVGKEYQNPFFMDQLEGIRLLVELIGLNLADYNLVIRMHPNLKGIKQEYATGVLDLDKKYPNIHVIPPESKVDSYALLDIANKVIVFGSSIGIEANFWRKPVILLAKSPYWLLDVAYIPSNKSEIVNLIEADLAPKKVEGSLKYGFYALKGGLKAKYYNQESLTSPPLFEGKALNDYTLSTRVLSKAIAFVYKLTNLKLQLKWIK